MSDQYGGRDEACPISTGGVRMTCGVRLSVRDGLGDASEPLLCLPADLAGAVWPAVRGEICRCVAPAPHAPAPRPEWELPCELAVVLVHRVERLFERDLGALPQLLYLQPPFPLRKT